MFLGCREVFRPARKTVFWYQQKDAVALAESLKVLVECPGFGENGTVYRQKAEKNLMKEDYC
jgi:hypothetical protein